MKLNQKIAQFLEILDNANNIPGLIMSGPGYGKTSTIELYCKYKGYNLTTLIASQYSADDILGLQSVIDGKLKRLTPAWFDEMMELASNGNKNILFIDELSTCDEFIQAPLLNLIFNHSLGLHKLPKDTLIVAAGNYANDLNNQFNMTAPLINRFMILNLSPNDVNLDELNNDFNDLINQSKDKIASYLGLNITSTYRSEVINSLKSHIISQANLDFSDYQLANKPLIGFASVRSVQYSINYIISANEVGLLNRYSISVVSDTLGPTKNNSTFFDSLIILMKSSSKTDLNQKKISKLSKSELNDYVKSLMSDYSKVTESIFTEVSNRLDDLDKDMATKFLMELNKYLDE